MAGPAEAGESAQARPAGTRGARGLSLSVKLSALVMLLLVLTVGAVYSYVEVTLRQALTEQILDKGRALLLNLRANASEARASGDDLLVGTYVDKLVEEEGVLYAAVYDPEGLVVAHSDHAKSKGTRHGSPPPRDGAPPTLLTVKGKPVHEFVTPLTWQGQVLGSAQLGLSAALVAEKVSRVRETVAMVTGALLLAGLLLSWLFVTLLTRPIKELARAADVVGTGRFETRVPVRSRDELGQLALTFNQMAERLKGVQEQVVEREKAQQQVAIAREISDSLLPSAVPRLPGVEFDVRSRIGKTAESEYYDFIEAGPNQIGVVLADVYDSGIHRAVNLAKVRSLMRYQAMGNAVASSVLSGVNFLLYRERMSVRMSYCVLDTQARTLSVAVAGYLPAFYYEASSGRLQVVNPGGMAMGLDMGSNFNYFIKNRVLSLASGDVVAWVSAGAGTVLERRKREVTDPALTQAVLSRRTQSARDIAAALDEALASAIGEMPAHDGYVVLAMKALERPAESSAPAVVRPGTLTAVPAAPPAAGRAKG